MWHRLHPRPALNVVCVDAEVGSGKRDLTSAVGDRRTDIPILVGKLQVTVSMSEDTSTSDAVALDRSPSVPAGSSMGAVMAHRGAEFGGPTSMMADALSVYQWCPPHKGSIACSPSVK